MIKCIILLFLFSCFSVYSKNQTEKLFSILDGKSSVDYSKIKDDDPLYPPMALADILAQTKNISPKETINKLEKILYKKNFSNFIEGKLSFSKDKFLVGTIDTFRLWRELLYLTLGRAYYESGDSKKAILYLKGIPLDSPFSQMGKLELGWSLLKVKKIEDLPDLIDGFESTLYKNASPEIKKEFKLLKAYYYVSLKKYKEAIKIADSFSLTHNKEQHNLQKKILAEAWFGIYLNELNDLNFTEKVKKLTKITNLSKQVDEKYHDAIFAFMAGEADWHLASVFRVRDPVKYKYIWWKYLVRAEKWMKPFVEKSIKEKKAYISEEAMFFSIALLWEMSKFKEASTRLVALPKIFPGGEYLEDVYQMLGDYHYDEKRFKLAIHYYEKLTKHGGEDKSAYGVYKAAWAFYNLEKKWTALRHLERLYIHYISDEKSEEEKGKGLFREVREDLLAIMAELLQWKKGLKEIEIFNLSKEKLITFKDDLAGSYNKIGKYDQAVNIWINLLKAHNSHANSPEWLASIGKAYLAAEQKQKIAKTFNIFLKNVINAHKDEKKIKKLDLDISRIILTVHKEARKSENQEDWVAVDKLYKIYEKNFVNSKNARMWYFGAQRYENLQKYWDAVEWYKKAAMIKKYENHLDAAHSMLRIVNDINDKLSLASKKSGMKIEGYKKIATNAKWYIDHFKKEQSSKLAEFIYVEALYHKKDPKGAEDYLLKRFANDKEDTYTSWNIFVNHNKRLYKNSEWKLTNDLAEGIYKYKHKLSAEWLINLVKIYQESAFQAAFTLNKNKKVDADKIRDLYHKSAYRLDEKYFDKNLALKSWNNLLLFYLNTKKYDLFKIELSKFKKVEELQISNLYDQNNLIYNVHNMASKVHTNTGEFYDKARDFYESSKFTSDEDEKISLLWDAALIFASYNDKSYFHKCIKIILNERPKYLDKNVRPTVLARLYYYFKDYENAWDILAKRANKKIKPKDALLFVDLYLKSFDNNKSLFTKMDNLKTEMQKSWKQIPYFSHLWAFDHMDEYKELTLRWKANVDRIPASLPQKLKEIVKIVKSELSRLALIKLEMKKSILSYAPQISVKVICTAPDVTKNTVRNLEKLTKNELKNPQWPKFLEKMNTKINKLKVEMENEQAFCKEQIKHFSHYPTKLISKVPCDENMCFKEDTPTKDIIAFEKDNNSADIVSKSLGLIKMGAFARAEYLISGLKDQKKLSFLMGIIRLSQGDTTNSVSLFKALEKDEKYKELTKPYIKYIALMNNYDSFIN